MGRARSYAQTDQKAAWLECEAGRQFIGPSKWQPQAETLEHQWFIVTNRKVAFGWSWQAAARGRTTIILNVLIA